MERNLEKDLEKLGLTKNESKVYMVLVRLGSCKAGRISKNSELDRSSVYNALRSLIAKGMVSYMNIGKTRWFQSSDPRNLVLNIEGNLEMARSLVPIISEMRKEKKLKEDVRLFKGLKGIKVVFEDIIANADENLVFGSEGQFSKNLPSLSKRISGRMKNKGIRVRSIIRSNRQLRDKDLSSNKRRIPSGIESPVVTNIYKDKIVIIIWSEVPEAILIQNKKAADAYRDYFEFMWKNAKR